MGNIDRQSPISFFKNSEREVNSRTNVKNGAERNLNTSICIQLARLGYRKATRRDLQLIVLRTPESEIQVLETL